MMFFVKKTEKSLPLYSHKPSTAMKKTLLLLFLLPFSLFAQVTDDFSDGDFTNNPTWTGTTDNYIVNTNQQLQLNTEGEGTAYLSLPISEYESMEWHFWIREAFSPSGNNYSDVWLSANNADLSQATQGYFLRFGEGGSNDAIELFRKDADGQQSICRGTEGAISSSFAVFVKVNCDREGNWMIQTCYDNSGIYIVETQGVDDTYGRGGFLAFGLSSLQATLRSFISTMSMSVRTSPTTSRLCS